ncbi:MAG: glycosyltransferase family 87 protein, partial [Thiohalocapsa sp.]
VGQGIDYKFFNYPPVTLLPLALLARLPYLAAFLLFEAATLALYLAVTTRILRDRSVSAVIVLLGFPLVYWNFGLGQNGFLTAGLFGAATLLIDRRPVVAGLLFGLLCYKPQFALLVPLALIAAAQWRALMAAAAAATALVLVSLALYGIDTWTAWIAAANSAPAMYQSGRILFAGMANTFGGARLIGLAPPLAYGLQAAVSLAAAAIVVVMWRRRLSLPTRAAVLAAASVVAAPLALLYDLMLGAVAAAWLVRDSGAPYARPWEKPALAALYLVLLDGKGAADRWHLPIYPLAALLLFALATGRAWREAAHRPAAGRQRSRTRSGLLAREQQISM